MIHIFKIKNINFVIDVYSGSIHQIDNIVFFILNYIKNKKNFLQKNRKCPNEILHKLIQLYNEEKINEAYNEIIQLYDENLIFSKEKDFIKNEISKHYNYNITKALCLNIVNFCNLKCEYCFVNMNNNTTKKDIMSKDVAYKAIDFLVEKSINIKNLEVDFFGGEPLLAFDLIKDVVKYSKKFKNKNFRFTITTNGILLDDIIIEYINSNIHNVILSLDGRKNINDMLRKHNDDNCLSTYDIIVPKFQKLILSREKLNKEYFVRGTFTNKNLDFSNDFKHLIDLNFNNISLEPILSKNINLNITEKNIDKIINEYEIISNTIIENYKNNKQINFYHYIFEIYNSPCVFKKIKGCGAGFEYLCIDTNGDIYPCHQLIENKDFKLGNIINKAIDNKNIHIKNFYKSSILNNSYCKDCWAKYYCSGGCLASNYNMNNDYNIVYELNCKIFKKRLEYSIYINYILNTLQC